MGKRRLEKALEKIDSSKASVSIHWHPFELDADLPRDGSLLKMDRYRQKFGQQRVEQMLPTMIETGRQEGIQFSYGGPIGSTFDSHRLLHFVSQQPDGERKQNQLINLIFAASFEQEKDLANHQVLTDLAVKIGLNRNEISDFLRSDLYKKEIRDQIEQNYRRGITGVPYFRFNNHIELSGAQDPQTIVQVFQKLRIPLLK